MMDGAVVLSDTNGADSFYPAGNAGKGSNPQPYGVILGAGAQIFAAANDAESAQTPGTATSVGSFPVTELGAKADKIGKDDNFRGLTICNHVLCYSKASGSIGVNTVCFLDTTGRQVPHLREGRDVGHPQALRHFVFPLEPTRCQR